MYVCLWAGILGLRGELHSIMCARIWQLTSLISLLACATQRQYSASVVEMGSFMNVDRLPARVHPREGLSMGGSGV